MLETTPQAMFKSTIVKEYHFFAAHRNENLKDKCHNMHGHTYIVKLGLDFTEDQFNKTVGVFLNFNEIDLVMEPLIKEFDHATFISEKDSRLMDCAKQFSDIFGKVVLMPEATSVENLAKIIGMRVQETNLKKFLSWISIKETTTSEVIINF